MTSPKNPYHFGQVYCFYWDETLSQPEPQPVRPKEFNAHAFYENMFVAIPQKIQDSPQPFFQAFADDLFISMSTSTNEQHCKDYILKNVKPGCYFLYPGGSLGRSLYKNLQTVDGVEIIGILDREQKTLEDIDITTISIDDFASNPGKYSAADGILVAHHELEIALIDQLREANIDEKLIIRVTSQRDFGLAWLQSTKATHLKFETEKLVKELAAYQGRPLIMSPRGYSQVREEELIQIFDEKILYCTFGPEFKIGHHDLFAHHVEFPRSPFVLCHFLQALNVPAVYFAGLIDDNNLPFIVQHKLPDLKVIQEIYDWACFYPDRMIRNHYNYNTGQIQALRVAEMFSVTHGNTIVSKRTGPRSQNHIELIGTNYHLYFQGFPDSIEEKRVPLNHSKKLELVYAGPLPYPNEDIDYHRQHLIDYLQQLHTHAQIDLFIFAANDPGSDFPKFEEIRKTFGSFYSSRIPLDQLVFRIREVDYGILAFNNEDHAREEPDIRLVASARAMTYLAAGIPIIVDETWDAIVEMIDQFDAGIVVKKITPANLPELIVKQVNRDRHRRGAIALREHLLKINETTIRNLSAVAAGFMHSGDTH